MSESRGTKAVVGPALDIKRTNGRHGSLEQRGGEAGGQEGDGENQSPDYDSPFHLVVWSEGRWAEREYTTQNYAVVVTLAFEEQTTVNLYEVMRAQVALPVVTRIRV